MKRAELVELHFITKIANVPSILEYGILCHRAADNLPHDSVAMPEIQERRADKTVPGGKPLHQYANLYITARNPMLYKRKAKHLELAVLRIDAAVLDLPNAIIADGNAASDYTRFAPSSIGLENVDRNLVFAESWDDMDQIAKWRKARVKCAEVLIPDKVDAKFIQGAFVSSAESEQELKNLAPELTIAINPHLFFR